MIHHDFTARSIWTGSGYLDPHRPMVTALADRVTIGDVARGLARRSRFAGHTLGDWPYSVAQHSVLCASLARQLCLSPTLESACLMHDAAEALTGCDVPRPVKDVPEMAPFRAMEDSLQRALLHRFGLLTASLEWAAMVKAIDHAALAIEKTWLIPAAAGDWPGVPAVPRQSLPISSLSPIEAEALFLKWAADLGIGQPVEAAA